MFGVEDNYTRQSWSSANSDQVFQLEHIDLSELFEDVEYKQLAKQSLKSHIDENIVKECEIFCYFARLLFIMQQSIDDSRHLRNWGVLNNVLDYITIERNVLAGLLIVMRSSGNRVSFTHALFRLYRLLVGIQDLQKRIFAVESGKIKDVKGKYDEKSQFMISQQQSTEASNEFNTNYQTDVQDTTKIPPSAGTFSLSHGGNTSFLSSPMSPPPSSPGYNQSQKEFFLTTYEIFYFVNKYSLQYYQSSIPKQDSVVTETNISIPSQQPHVNHNFKMHKRYSSDSGEDNKNKNDKIKQNSPQSSSFEKFGDENEKNRLHQIYILSVNFLNEQESQLKPRKKISSLNLSYSVKDTLVSFKKKLSDGLKLSYQTSSFFQSPKLESVHSISNDNLQLMSLFPSNSLEDIRGKSSTLASSVNSRDRELSLVSVNYLASLRQVKEEQENQVNLYFKNLIYPNQGEYKQRNSIESDEGGMSPQFVPSSSMMMSFAQASEKKEKKTDSSSSSQHSSSEGEEDDRKKNNKSQKMQEFKADKKRRAMRPNKNDMKGKARPKNFQRRKSPSYMVSLMQEVQEEKEDNELFNSLLLERSLRQNQRMSHGEELKIRSSLSSNSPSKQSPLKLKRSSSIQLSLKLRSQSIEITNEDELEQQQTKNEVKVESVQERKVEEEEDAKILKQNNSPSLKKTISQTEIKDIHNEEASEIREKKITKIRNLEEEKEVQEQVLQNEFTIEKTESNNITLSPSDFVLSDHGEGEAESDSKKQLHKQVSEMKIKPTNINFQLTQDSEEGKQNSHEQSEHTFSSSTSSSNSPTSSVFSQSSHKNNAAFMKDIKESDIDKNRSDSNGSNGSINSNGQPWFKRRNGISVKNVQKHLTKQGKEFDTLGVTTPNFNQVNQDIKREKDILSRMKRNSYRSNKSYGFNADQSIEESSISSGSIQNTIIAIDSKNKDDIESFSESSRKKRKKKTKKLTVTPSPSKKRNSFIQKIMSFFHQKPEENNGKNLSLQLDNDDSMSSSLEQFHSDLNSSNTYFRKCLQKGVSINGMTIFRIKDIQNYENNNQKQYGNKHATTSFQIHPHRMDQSNNLGMIDSRPNQFQSIVFSNSEDFQDQDIDIYSININELKYKYGTGKTLFKPNNRLIEEKQSIEFSDLNISQTMTYQDLEQLKEVQLSLILNKPSSQPSEVNEPFETEEEQYMKFEEELKLLFEKPPAQSEYDLQDRKNCLLSIYGKNSLRRTKIKKSSLNYKELSLIVDEEDQRVERAKGRLENNQRCGVDNQVNEEQFFDFPRESVNKLIYENKHKEQKQKAVQNSNQNTLQYQIITHQLNPWNKLRKIIKTAILFYKISSSTEKKSLAYFIYQQEDILKKEAQNMIIHSDQFYKDDKPSIVPSHASSLNYNLNANTQLNDEFSPICRKGLSFQSRSQRYLGQE